jgi:multidrug efflux pump subunit AcrA (membrane-fusion protein)
MTSHAAARLAWRLVAAVAALTAVVVVVSGFLGRSDVDDTLVAVVRRGPLTSTITTTGILEPIRSITYNSPLGGREVEITRLVPEGTRVQVGDLLAALDTTELQQLADRARQDVRQAHADVQVAAMELREAEANLAAVAKGEGALTLEEARSKLQLAEKKVDRLREEYAQLKPLLDKGYLTRDELRKTGDALEQAEDDLSLSRKRAAILADVTHPRDEERAQLQLAQKTSRLENARAKAGDADAGLNALVEAIGRCRILAKRPGLVVYEELLTSNPRRKIRVGDRVSASQGLVTIPEVDRMVLDTSVTEAAMHRVRVGQDAIVRVEAFPDLRLKAVVTRVGVLARAAPDRSADDKRFEVVVELERSVPDLRPEMTARADIVTASRSNVLLAPVTAVFDDGGATVAHVVGRFGVETVPVVIGESDDAQVEIVQGVREGDRLMLVDPARERPSTAPPERTHAAAFR